MSTVIIVDPLNLGSIRDAVAELKAQKEEIERKTDEVLNRLAELGKSVAEAHYASGILDDNDSVRVYVEPSALGYSIIAEGEDVCFLEFGTGVAAGNGYDTSVIEPPVSIEPASWSSTKGTGEFAKYGSWHHDGRKYIMTVPRMGMYHAVKEIQRQYKEIAKEVFND